MDSHKEKAARARRERRARRKDRKTLRWHTGQGFGLTRVGNKDRASKTHPSRGAGEKLALYSASLQQASWKKRAFRNTQVLASKRRLRGSFLPGCQEKEKEKKPNRSSGHFLRILFSQAGPLSSPAPTPPCCFEMGEPRPKKRK